MKTFWRQWLSNKLVCDADGPKLYVAALREPLKTHFSWLCRKALRRGLPRRAIPIEYIEAPPPTFMFRVSKDTPAYYLTSVAKDRLPVFRTNLIAEITCGAINEARKSGGFLIFAYVLMPDHLHLVTDSSRSSKETHRFVNGIVSRRIIDHLKTSGPLESLEKLKIVEQSKGHKYSLWQHHSDTRLLWSEEMLRQRINYTHLNPVRASLVEHPDEWPWSSSRIWHKRCKEFEPLDVDLDEIHWRK